VTGLPRVAHVATTPEFIAHFVWPDIRRLASRVDATVYCANGPDVARFAAAGLAHEVIPIQRKITPVADLRTLWVLSRRLRRVRFRLLNTYVPKGGLLGQLSGVLAGVPARVHACHGLLYTPSLPWWRRQLYRATDRLTNRLAHRTVYVSQADLEFSVREGLCSPSKARYVGCGLDLAAFDRATVPPQSRDTARAELGIEPAATVLLTIGRYVADKGFYELGESVAALRADHPSIRCVWVAPVLPGEEGALPDDYLSRQGLDGTVLRLPFQRDVRRLYVAADLLVHPSHREGTPRVPMEAAAMGLPMVLSDIPGCREVVPNDDMAVFVPPRNGAALRSALRHVIANLGEMARRAERARAFVRARFDGVAATERLWDVYRELLGPRG